MEFICDQCGTRCKGLNQIHLEGDVYMFCHPDCLAQYVMETSAMGEKFVLPFAPCQEAM
jgi:hypothetical protein